MQEDEDRFEHRMLGAILIMVLLILTVRILRGY